MAHEHFYVKRSERESLVQPELIYTGLLEDAPNWFNIQHSHDFCEILYVAGGAGEAILEGKKFRLAPGDLVVVNPGTLHEERSDAKAPLRLIFLAIRDFAVPGLPAGCLSQEKYRVLSCGEYRYKMDIYLRELLQETSSQIEFYQEISQGLVSALLVLVMRLIRINPEDEGVQNLSMNIYIIEREFLVHMISEAYSKGMVYFDRDLLAPNLERLNVRGFEFNGYLARISDIKSYFDENMKLLEDENLDGLFGGNPIYTKIRDDNPTRYIQGSKAKNIMSADGCIIEGEVENSILFRGVRIAKGAKVKNCVLMQDTIVGEGANVEYVITDKNVTISAGKEIKGADSFPVYVAKYRSV